ncbi:hypothetical protein EK904_014772, partial [Melospiza melodia maxima]
IGRGRSREFRRSWEGARAGLWVSPGLRSGKRGLGLVHKSPRDNSSGLCQAALAVTMATPSPQGKVQLFYIFIATSVCLKFTRATLCWDSAEEESPSWYTGLKGTKSSELGGKIRAKMPSRKKTSMFASAFCTCVSSFVVICVALATPQWVSSEVRFSGLGSTVTISLTYGLFSGTCEQFFSEEQKSNTHHFN